MSRKILREFGFKTDQSGIINRYLRENGAWDEHLAKTKQYILKSAENKNKNVAIMLGSGWLLDVPAAELSEMFGELILVDVFHPRQVKHKFKGVKNVKFLDTDITGLAEPIYELLKKKPNENSALKDIKPLYNRCFIDYMQKADFIASVNILNQLDILICDYISQFNIYGVEEINVFRRYIQSSHIELLPKGKSTIITDYEEINLDDNENVISRNNLIYTDLLPKQNISRWTWKFDQSKTYHKDCKTFFKVMAAAV